MFSDPILKKLIKKYPKPHFTDKSEFLFEALVESIISQQLSVKASDTIFKRFKSLFSGHPELVSGSSKNKKMLDQVQHDKVYRFPSPKQVLEKNDDEIRNAGISFRKISYIKSVAHAFVSDLIDVKKIKTMSDEEVIAALTQIKGVGRWTAEMILIFTLNRPDVFSIGDLGIRNAIEKLYRITKKEEILKLAENWKPNRSTACWYLWRSLENNN